MRIDIDRCHKSCINEFAIGHAKEPSAYNCTPTTQVTEVFFRFTCVTALRSTKYAEDNVNGQGHFNVRILQIAL